MMEIHEYMRRGIYIKACGCKVELVFKPSDG